MNISVETLDNSFKVRFPYDAQVVAAIKTIPGKQFRKDMGNCWLIPKTSERALQRFIAKFSGDSTKQAIERPYVDPQTIYPSCIKTEPWPHQLDALRYLWNREAGLLHIGMRCGKTKIIVDLIINKSIPRTLIVCPKTVIPVWPQEFSIHGGKPVVCVGLSKGTAQEKLDRAQQALDDAKRRNTSAVIVLSYGAVAGRQWTDTQGIMHVSDALQEWALDAEFDLLVTDECFTAGTLIDTPEGQRRIEDIQEGDVVYGYDHETSQVVMTQVSDAFSRQTTSELFPFFGTYGTGAHPIWTAEAGYIPLDNFNTAYYTVLKFMEDVDVYDGVSAVRHGVYTKKDTEILQSPLSGCRKDISLSACVCLVSHAVQAYTKYARVLFSELSKLRYSQSTRTKDETTCFDEKLTPESCVSGEANCLCKFGQEPFEGSEGGFFSQNGQGGSCAQRLGSGVYARQWQTTLTCSHAFVASFGGALASTSFHQPGAATERISDTLCCGHRAERFVSGYRSGRSVPQTASLAGVRCEKGYEASRDGLARSTYTRRCNTSEYSNGVTKHQVYNLTTGTGNYFAQHILVHNCQRHKAAGGKTATFLYRLAAGIPMRVGLSGTPFAHSPLDSYGIYRVLDPAIFGTNFSKFREQYAELEPVPGTMAKRIKRDYITGREIYKNTIELRQKINQIRFHAPSSVIKLPPVVHTVIPVEMGEKAEETYLELAEELVAEVGTGHIIASHAGVLITRLQQITSGWVPVTDEDDKSTMRPLDTGKRDALQDWLEDAPDEPLVVFCRFKADLAQVRDVSLKLGRPCFELSGSRNELADWQDPSTPHSAIIAVQIDAGAVGIRLDKASRVLYYSYTWQNGNYLQSLERVRHPSKTDTCFCDHLVAQLSDGKPSIDDVIRRTLGNRQEVIQMLCGTA